MPGKLHLVLVFVLYIPEVYCATKLIHQSNTEDNSSTVHSIKHYDRYIPKINSDAKMMFENRIAELNKIQLHLFDRIKRRVKRPKSLSSNEYLPLQNKLTECAVDTRICDCYRDVKTNQSNINCRYKNLYNIPEFKSVDTIYHKITFSANNYIKSLPTGAFRNLKVEQIDLLNNKLAQVQSGAFQGLEPYLYELLIEGNGVPGVEIPFPVMSVLRKLRRLKVKNFKQDSISSSNYFPYFPDLEALEFDSIPLESIDNLAFFKKLTKLQLLNFQYAEFVQIPVVSLSYLESLNNLYIRFTKINTVLSKSFEKLTNLLDLDLSFNQIETLESDAFLGVANHLTHLDLGSNKLQPHSLVALSRKQWTNLKHLTLSYNDGLTYMPANVFKNMPNLEELFLVNLNLVHISRDLFTGLDNLLSLDLGWNNIESIQDGAFLNMNKLFELKLEYQFNSAPVPKTLQLNPGAFKGLETSLIYLFLEGTTLGSYQLWTTLRLFKELQQLAMSETKVSEIPYYAFRENKKLTRIELNKNGIKYLNQATFKGLEYSLKDVSLNDNNLETISDCVFQNFQKLDYIHLMRNPLMCDCRLKWLHNFVLEKNKTVPTFSLNDFICKQPQNYANMPLYKIPINELICTKNNPERCIDDELTSSPVKTVTTATRSTTKSTTQSSTDNWLQLSIEGRTSSSFTIAWRVSDQTTITGFQLEHQLTTFPESSKTLKIHKDERVYTIHDLIQGNLYQICVTAELTDTKDKSVKDCKVAQTIGKSSYTDKQSSSDSRNIIIGAIIATVAVVVLVAVGVCAVVKYKVQRLKELRFALNSPIQRNPYTEDGMNVCVVPNEYTEIDVARLANKYKIKCPKDIQRQFGIDNTCYKNGEEISPYNTYQRIGKGKRKNPYENDDEEDVVILNTESDQVHFKTDLEERHSAPSRLDAGDLKNHYDRNSRPLPATPADQSNQKRSSTLKPVKKVKPVKKQVLVAKASVYNNKDEIDKQNED
ncbi:leucine-rich repeat neuronal protein 1-like [Ruditapes philippinarum]|uniref:leucine-rich repeat neuronal protein 1-like n=1 Tax=Ruditapes philippinarum TaxID=129788 RepID=UPI00295B2BC8|nr:leucine-rich repeat neuronal protein 1-like [Ruditapes philippinarum]